MNLHIGGANIVEDMFNNLTKVIDSINLSYIDVLDPIIPAFKPIFGIQECLPTVESLCHEKDMEDEVNEA